MRTTEQIRKRKAAWYRLNQDRIRAARLVRYWENPEREHRRMKEWRLRNIKACRLRESALRALNRSSIRAKARLESLTLTDQYIRRRLSHCTKFPTKHWTQQQVNQRRASIIALRAKRTTMATACKIRDAYLTNPKHSTNTLAREFGVTQGLVWCIVRNRCHRDPDYVPPNRNQSARFLKLCAAATRILK